MLGICCSTSPWSLAWEHACSRRCLTRAFTPRPARVACARAPGIASREPARPFGGASSTEVRPCATIETRASKVAPARSWSMAEVPPAIAAARLSRRGCLAVGRRCDALGPSPWCGAAGCREAAMRERPFGAVRGGPRARFATPAFVIERAHPRRMVPLAEISVDEGRALREGRGFLRKRARTSTRGAADRDARGAFAATGSSCGARQAGPCSTGICRTCHGRTLTLRRCFWPGSAENALVSINERLSRHQNDESGTPLRERRPWS